LALASRYWQELTTKEFASLDAERVVAVLPVAAVEQHGPHLPITTDALINAGILERALVLAPSDLPILVLPAQAVGKSDEHMAFAGTLTLSAATLTAALAELGQSVHRAGVRRLVLFNSHGGQPQVLEIVARDLRIRSDMLATTCSWWRLGLPDGLFTDEERAYGIHAGGIETSMVMHLRPDLVREGERADFRSLGHRMAPDFRRLGPTGPDAGFGWQAQDLHPAGAAGNALDADAERGRALVEHAARRLVELLEEVARFPLDALAQAPEFPAKA
jgi:creatinine amidohydrolase